MTRRTAHQRTDHPGIVKAPTGVRGLDEITGGGLPAGRRTLVCGNAGSGKTLLATEFLVKGALQFNEMLGGTGFHRGSSVLVSATGGMGKTSLAAAFAHAACTRGERAIFFAFEESPSEITRNMRSIGIDLGRWVKKDLLLFHAIRPTAYGLERHLATMHQLVETDAWVILKDLGSNGDRRRGLYVLKSRGMWHSDKIREFYWTAKGIQLPDRGAESDTQAPLGAAGLRLTRPQRGRRWSAYGHRTGGLLMSHAIDGLDQFERMRPEHPPQRYVLKLYVSGATPKSLQAVERTKSICDTAFAGRYQLEIVDIFQQPARAARDQVIAVPMLVKEQPLPVRRLVGTLSNPTQVLQAFGTTGIV